MRLIEKVSYQSANFITSFLNQNHNKRMILYFGFQAIYGDLLKLLIIIICSLILRSFIPSILISFSFAYLRKMQVVSYEN
ncbi:accessory gene regulator B family protein [Ruminiclostridium josui]|uniref:accessory gene regulator B family protein n=1 Tax=Ruminiclostridium josui TaxID=1499 RepID=UPI0006D02F21